MPEGKRKFIEDAARVIDGRVEELKKELARTMEHHPDALCLPGDRAAIAEAEHCARLIRTLGAAPYRGDPYKIAHARWGSGKFGR